jgi:hypothetical protein
LRALKAGPSRTSMRKKSEKRKDPPTAVIPHALKKRAMVTNSLRPPSRRAHTAILSGSGDRSRRAHPAKRPTSLKADGGKGMGTDSLKALTARHFRPSRRGKKPPLPEKRGWGITRSRKTIFPNRP